MKLRKKLKSFLHNVKGAMGYRSVIMIGVSLFVVGIVLPLGISEIANATTTNWDASVVTIFQTLLPVLAVIGVAIAYIKTR